MAERDALNEDYFRSASDYVCRRITSLVSYRYAKTLLLYCPVKSELNILPLAEYAKKDGKQIAFPKCNPPDRTMRYHIVPDVSVLESGSYGIPEPSADFPAVDAGSSSDILCIIPALVFDREGYRLGYGGGYYDRFLAGFAGTKIGAGFGKFVTGHIPRSKYDSHVDVLVTEKGVLSFYEN